MSKESYIHAKWMTEMQLINSTSNGRAKLSKFLECDIHLEEDSTHKDDFFSIKKHINEDYITVDRIINVSQQDLDQDRLFLVKWKSLGYDECTWEEERELLHKAINVKVGNGI
jgi:hypothetical protein